MEVEILLVTCNNEPATSSSDEPPVRFLSSSFFFVAFSYNLPTRHDSLPISIAQRCDKRSFVLRPPRHPVTSIVRQSSPPSVFTIALALSTQSRRNVPEPGLQRYPKVLLSPREIFQLGPGWLCMFVLVSGSCGN